MHYFKLQKTCNLNNGKIILCPPVICLKNTLPTCGLKIGTLPTRGWLHLSHVTHLC